MINDQPLVSVILSVYNSDSSISKAIESLLAQSYKNLEILILDDASTDKSYEICSEYEKQHKKISLFRNKENLGLTASLNILIGHSKGDYIARQDADDVSTLDRLEVQMKQVIKLNLDACCSRALVMDTNRVIPGFSYFLPIKLLLKYKNPFIHGTLVIKKEVLNQLKGYDEMFVFAQDYKLMSDLVKRRYKVKIINRTLYQLNMENNISNIFKKEQEYYSMCVKQNIQPTKQL